MDFTKLIPENVRAWLGLAFVLVVGVGTLAMEWNDLGTDFTLWTRRFVGILYVISTTLGLKVPAIPKKAAVPTGILLVAILFAGCTDPYRTARGTTAGVMHAVKATSKGLASGSAAELKAGGDKVVVCKRLKVYRDTIRPAARSSIAASLAAIRIAKEAGKKEFKYIDVLKPGGCALLLGLREWGHKLPDQGAGILPYLDPFLGSLCKTPKSAAAAILAAVLPVAVELVKWIVDLVGKPSDSIDAEIAAWLLAPAADEVDALIKAECGA